MPKKRASSAKRHAPYTDEEKQAILKTARILFANGESNHAAAKNLGINPHTLKKWLKEVCSDEEAQGAVDRVREKLNSKMNFEVNLDVSKAKEKIEGLKEFMDRPKLSWEEVRKLCREYETISRMAWLEIQEGRGGKPLDAMREWILPHAQKACDQRKAEIESLIGMDAIHEYRDRKATRLLIEEAEDRCQWKIENLLQQTFVLRIFVSFFLGCLIGNVLFNLFV